MDKVFLVNYNIFMPYHSNEDYSDQELKEIYESLGLYVPADVTRPAEIADYYKLFDALRVLHMGYNDLNKDEVVEKFYDYYNAHDDDKIGLLITLQNRVEDLNYLDGWENDEETVADDVTETLFEAFQLLRQGEDGKNRAASFLYTIETGEVPQENSDLTRFYQIVDEYDSQEKDARSEMLAELQSRVNPEITPQYQALTPEEVALKYLKGSGYIDPATRNSGFRVDRDINFEE